MKKKIFFPVSRSTCSDFYIGKTEWNIYEDGEKYTQAVYQHLLQEVLCQPWWSVGCFGSRDVCSTVVRVSAFRGRASFLAPSSLQWVVQIWSVPLWVQDRMRNDPVLCQTSEMALPESVRFQYIDHPARGCLGCFDNRIKLASEEGMIC